MPYRRWFFIVSFIGVHIVDVFGVKSSMSVKSSRVATKWVVGGL